MDESMKLPFAQSRLHRAMLAVCLSSSLLLPITARANDAVQAQSPWFRYLLPTTPAGGYVTLRNTSGSPSVLTGADSPACGSIMLHRTESSGGVERMIGVSSITVPPHGTFAFSPGGYHIMCIQPKMHAGERVPVTLNFADGSQVSASFVVRAANASAGGAMPMKMSQ